MLLNADPKIVNVALEFKQWLIMILWLQKEFKYSFSSPLEEGKGFRSCRVGQQLNFRIEE